MTLTLLPGHCLDVLPTLPSESVQTVVTSPPYYGLRAYGTPPQVWGGDSDCVHEWGQEAIRSVHAKRDHDVHGNFGSTRNQEPARAGSSGIVPGGAICSLCQAWRGELGQEPTLALYIAHLVSVFAAVRRVLRPDGTLWVNLGDSYSNAGQAGGDRRAGQANGGKAHYTPQEGLGPKQLLMVPARFALAMQDAGWVLRSDIIWHKPNAMPESVQDRPTKAHEYLFLFARQERYYYDASAIMEPLAASTIKMWGTDTPPRQRQARAGLSASAQSVRGAGQANFLGSYGNQRNKRTVWTIPTVNYDGAHFATFPPALVRPCILAGSSQAGQCPVCGAPWARVVETQRNGKSIVNAPNAQHLETLPHGLKLDPTRRLGPDIQDVSITTGWQPSCRCNAGDPVPQTVLDVFAGTFTVGQMAATLGRNAVGIDLQPAYITLAEERTAIIQPELLLDAV